MNDMDNTLEFYNRFLRLIGIILTNSLRSQIAVKPVLVCFNVVNNLFHISRLKLSVIGLVHISRLKLPVIGLFDISQLRFCFLHYTRVIYG